MGRRRSTNLHLPQRVYIKNGAYWHVVRLQDGKVKWTRLASVNDYGAALRALAKLEGGMPASTNTVSAAVHAYLQHCEQRAEAGEMSHKTVKGYTSGSVELLQVMGSADLADVTDQEVRRYRTSRKAKNGKPAPIAANRELALLSASYSHAAECGLIPSSMNPCAGVKRNKERARQRYITHEELALVLAKAHPLLEAAIRISVSTGIRQTDLLRLRLGDIGAEGLTVRASKTKKALIYEWTPELRAGVELARSQRRRVATLWLFPGREPGQHLTKDGLESIWERCRKAAGLKDVQWRDLRRKAGSDTTEAHATELLDHSSSATTKKHYRAAPKRVKPTR